jgi:serine/threonine protein phosphatase 1
MKRYVIGDIHGGYRAFKSLLEQVNFDYENDLLICLGDIVDGWSEVKQCLDLMFTIEKLIYIRGNHEQLYLDYFSGDMEDPKTASSFGLWTKHGGTASIKSLGVRTAVDEKYIDFMECSLPYYELNDKVLKRLFVHAGVPVACCTEDKSNAKKLEDVNQVDFLWTRDTAKEAYKNGTRPGYTYGDKYDKIYLGHTPTQKLNISYSAPQYLGNIWLLDTGACFKGRLSMMDIDTEQVWQSKPVNSYYPDEKGRNEKSYNDEQLA